MANLELIIQQISSEIQVDERGKGFASIRGAARLCGVDEKLIRSALKSAEETPSKLAETLIETGYAPAELSKWRTDGIPDIAVGEIVGYYAYEAGHYCTQEAKLACKAFRAMGIRIWMQQITGWSQPEQSKSASLIDQARLLLATLEQQEEIRRQQEAIAAQQAAIEKSCKQIEAAQQEQSELLKEHEAEFDRLQSPAGHYFSIVGYASLLGVSVDIETAKTIGRKASRLCRDGGYRKGQLRDPRFGDVGTYPQEVLQIVFQEEGYIKRPA